MRAVAPKGGAVKPPRRAKAGRTCSAPYCDTLLSAYNTGGACWIHTQARIALPPRGRKRRGKKDDPPRRLLSLTQLEELVGG